MAVDAHNSLSKQEIYEAEITDLAVGGRGVARVNGKVVFVEKGIPGQRVKIQLYKNRKDYAESRVVEVIERGSLYEDARCDHFSQCGGCAIQHMRYEAQLAYKRHWVEESLTRIGKLQNPPVGETVPSPDIYYYRNKMEFTFAAKVWDAAERRIAAGRLGLGLHLPGRYDTVVNIDACFLQSERSTAVVKSVREFAVQSRLPPYDVQRHRGFWRFLVIREGKRTGEMLVNIITNRCDDEQRRMIGKLALLLEHETGAVTAFFHAEHPGRSQAAVWDALRKVSGKDAIDEKIGALDFRIGCDTFFQINTRQAENLYDTIRRLGKFTGNETVYDLYSGVGTIPVYLSGSVGSVIGMELNPASVEAARQNAQRNNAENCRFIQGRVRALIKYPPDLYRRYGRPGVIIVDPPRSGMDPKTVSRVANLGAQKIIYVSCSPATLSRDIQLLAGQYEAAEVIPVDMFPHTSHVEAVALLVKTAAQPH